MKKNFMAIASLLIAAMLLVVSCAPEANVEGKVEDNGLVNASLMATAAGKALTVSYPENEALSYTITLDAKWDKNSEYKMDEIVGDQKTISLTSISSDPIDLGWISQGLWTVTVEGKRNNVTVVKGSTTKYITKGNEGVVVFLGTDTESTKETNISFEIIVNELEKDKTNYDLKATIERADKVTGTPTAPKFSSESVKTDGKNNNTRKYTGNTKLTPGYYKVTVQLIKTTPASAEGGQATEEVIGGITRGVLVTGESTITIKGSVSASDFAKGSLTVYTPTVKINNFTAMKNGSPVINKSSYNDDNQRYEGTATCADGSYRIKYTVNASLDGVPGPGVTVSSAPTYTWIVDGKVEKVTNSEGREVELNAPSCEVTYSAPGDKNVTCIITYACTATIAETNYDFTIGNEAVAYVQVKEQSN